MIERLLDINQGDSGKAPHKPLLLLTLIELIETGLIQSNKFPINDDLRQTFNRFSKDLGGERKTPIVLSLPYYHLRGDGFWHLKLKPRSEVALLNNSPKSLKNLKATVDFAYLDHEVYDFLQVPSNRKQLKELLMITYFPGVLPQSSLISKERKSYLQDLERSFFNYDVAEPESYSMYKRRDRDYYFQTKIPFFYNFKCAISGSFIKKVPGERLLDSCHIIPLDSEGPNAIQNGIALSPTLHRAFDKYMISISEDYRVLVSKAFEESFSSPFNLHQFEGKQILLPQKEEWYPSQEALAWHRSQLLT